MVMQTWLFVLAGAQQRTRVSIHHTMLNVTHHHTSVTTQEANLPAFTEYVHREMSKALGVLLAEQRYEAPEQIFEDRQTHQMRLLDAPACMSHITYERLNGVAAGLVQQPGQMPDCRFDYGLWRGQPLTIKRPPFYFNPKTTEPERELHFEVDPLTFLEFSGDLDSIIHHYRRAERSAVASFRRARTFPVLGAKRLRRIHPYDEPRSKRKAHRGVIPTFKLGARGVTGRTQRILACKEVTAFRRAHSEANRARRDCEEAVFPAGTYKMRVAHNVSVAEPGLDAIVTAPGLTLDDVADVLQTSTLRARSGAPQEVTAAFAEEAEELLATDRMSFLPAEAHDRVESEVEVRHQHEQRRASGSARIIVLRDSRRGRPRKPKGREPPE